MTFRDVERVLRSIFSQMNKFISHLWTNYISTMTHILKCFYPYNTGSLNRSNKHIKPEFFHETDFPERKEHNDR